MDTKTLGKLVSKMCDKLKATLTSKGIEYSIEDDRLINFRNAGAMNSQTPEQALWGMVTKHIIALHDFIERDANRIEVPEEQWDEKIGDIIAYMVLLKALREDKPTPIENSPTPQTEYVISVTARGGCISEDLETSTDSKSHVYVFSSKEEAERNIEDNGAWEQELVMTFDEALKKGYLK